MKTECPFCRQHYDVENQFLNQEATCTACGKSFQLQPLQSGLNTSPTGISNENNREVKTNVRQGALIGAGICLLVALCFHMVTNFLIILYAPLYFAAFVLSIIAMAQKRIWGGLLFLIASIILPSLIFVINLALFANETVETVNSTSISKNSNSLTPVVDRVAHPKNTNIKSSKPSSVIEPELSGLCGVNFGSRFQVQKAISTGKLTNGIPYYTISLKKYFMDFKDVSVLITPKTNRIYTIWMSRKFSSGSMAREEFEKIKAVLEKHYNRQGTSERFSVDPKYCFEFNNATIILRANILFSSGEIEIIATDKKLRTLAEKEARTIAIEETDTSVL